MSKKQQRRRPKISIIYVIRLLWVTTTHTHTLARILHSEKVLFSRIIKILLYIFLLSSFALVKVVLFCVLYWNFYSEFSLFRWQDGSTRFARQMVQSLSLFCTHGSRVAPSSPIYHCTIRRFILCVIQCHVKWDLFGCVVSARSHCLRPILRVIVCFYYNTRFAFTVLIHFFPCYFFYRT